MINRVIDGGAPVVTGLAFLLAGIVLGRRNNQVHRFLTAMLVQISEMNQEEIERGNHSYIKRYQAFDSIEYSDMVFRFWRAPERFYCGTVLEDIAIRVAREQKERRKRN